MRKQTIKMVYRLAGCGGDGDYGKGVGNSGSRFRAFGQLLCWFVLYSNKRALGVKFFLPSAAAG